MINEQEEYELVSYEQINTCPGLRAFLFERKGLRHVVYWHESGEGRVQLPLQARDFAIKEALDRPPLDAEEKNGQCLLPAGKRRYLISALSREEICDAFQKAGLSL